MTGSEFMRRNRPANPHPEPHLPKHQTHEPPFRCGNKLYITWGRMQEECEGLKLPSCECKFPKFT
jgi:hypothetical protein